MSNGNKKISWNSLAVMAFASVWGFGNIVNGFASQGMKVVVSWILMFALYFVPYALMVGEMGSSFKDSKGGVSSWIKTTSGPKLAFLAGWTYWVVHVPYLAQKPQGILIALGWAVNQNGSLVKNMNPMILQSICLVVFLLFLWIASRGVNSIKRIGTIAGTSMFVMSILYVILAIAAPAITTAHTYSIDFSMKSLMPDFNFEYLTTLAILVFAVGGCEKISPYVNNMKNPSKDFPKGMIALAVMVAVTALLGSFAMGMMFDPNNIPKDLMMNGAYYAFQKLGQYYGLGNFFLIIYAIANTIGQISALAISIDAPIKVLLADTDNRFIPKSLTKVTENGTPINGYKLTAVLVGTLIIVPALGIGDMTSLFNWLLRLNAVVMPLRYLWVFFAYMALKKAVEGKFEATYQFAKNKAFGFLAGLWCFGFTAFACIMGMFPKGVKTYSSEWYFQITLNVLTPVVLLGLGLILPMIAKKTNKETENTAA
ncbi:amino acid permease [Clostridium sp. OS1-26]|uniref:amino acid permease n=1 Tax=Clostridium sp. OS1-26 TaxID=3070681 RepID=UPI0027E1D8E8|nr:amino acid permease [Clostridium sp. OS1-26]WML33242.1 amino acid permease [Clostridium sp. OS1-26]